jgi:hypothetical protein
VRAWAVAFASALRKSDAPPSARVCGYASPVRAIKDPTSGTPIAWSMRTAAIGSQALSNGGYGLGLDDVARCLSEPDESLAGLAESAAALAS